jgi:DNA-binding MltR family transcriptional regulator
MDYFQILKEKLSSIQASHEEEFKTQYVNALITTLEELGIDPKKIEQFGLKEVMAFRESLRSETDRGCALMAAAFLDEKLKNLLQAFLINDPKSFEYLFYGTGGLSSFSSRIEMAYLLGFISPNMKRDLNMIRKIRNEFAHSAEVINFNTSPISDRCNELKYVPETYRERSPRDKFIRASFIIAGIILGHTLSTERRTFKQDSFEMLQEPMKDIEGAISNKVFEVFDQFRSNVNEQIGISFSISVPENMAAHLIPKLERIGIPFRIEKRGEQFTIVFPGTPSQKDHPS